MICSIAHKQFDQGFKPQAMAVTGDPEHKFELALGLGDLKVAYQIAKDAQVIVSIVDNIVNGSVKIIKVPHGFGNYC